ncbi:MAG: hypothetical protein CV087_07075 [Candidatus Brocadia sp. WS118]|nr:MAG: hypothetical protein CV087_07075 [Candidatus Brocadia sp. WS118]
MKISEFDVKIKEYVPLWRVPKFFPGTQMNADKHQYFYVSINISLLTKQPLLLYLNNKYSKLAMHGKFTKLCFSHGQLSKE